MNSDRYDLSTVKGRLLFYLKEKRIPQTEFCRKLGVAPTYIGVIRKSIPPEKINRIVSLYPDLSRDWLLYGEGDMYTKEAMDPRRYLHENGYLVPLLPVNAFAGNISAWSQSVNSKDCEKVISPVQVSPAMTLFFLAGGMIMARNMPYRPTFGALTTFEGRTFPLRTPRQVPSAQPGAAVRITP